MKIIAFISHRYIENYDFSLLIKESDYVIAFVFEPFINQFPKNKLKYFNEIIQLPVPSTITGPLIKFDENILKIKVKEIIDRFNCRDKFRLICVDEVNMTIAARIRDEFNIHGLRENDAKLFQNKILMKNCLRKSKILLPNYQLFDIYQAKLNYKAYYIKLKNHLGNHFVLKPCSYTGSFGVWIIKNINDFILFMNSKDYTYHQYDAETYIKGDLYHCDIGMIDHKIVFLECCKYTYPNNDFSKGKVIASLIMPRKSRLKSRITDVATESLQHLGAENGVFHVELFVTSEKIYFLEVAARPAGGLVAKMYEQMTGINLFTLDLSAHLGINIPIIKNKKRCFALQALIPINRLLIENFNNTKFSSQKHVQWLINLDNMMNSTSKSVVDVAGKVLFISNNYKDIRSDFNILKKLRSFHD